MQRVTEKWLAAMLDGNVCGYVLGFASALPSLRAKCFFNAMLSALSYILS